MNMSQFNRSFHSQSVGSNPAHFNNPQQSNMKNVYSSMGINMPENGGMLKRAIRFEYEYSHVKKEPLSEQGDEEPQPQVRPFMAEDPPKMRKTESDWVTKAKGPAPLPSANMFSCMDTPDYQRDFEISPKIMEKQRR